MQIKYITHAKAQPSSLLRKTAAIIVTAAVTGVALMFSVVVLTVLLAIGVLGAAYLWWKTRELRKHLGNLPPRGAAMERESAVFKNEAFDGEIIEGEVIRVHQTRDDSRR